MSPYRAAPILLRTGRRVIYSSRVLPSQIPAIAILLPRRVLSTETSTSSGGGGGGHPPPGFNLDQAKKPLSQEQKNGSSKKHETQKVSTTTDLKQQTQKDEPSLHPPTKVTEAQSLSELAAEKATAEKADEKKMTKKKEDDKKLTIWQRVKKEMVHYWDGTKLLAAEVNISLRLALKMAAGYELTRRENRQVSFRCLFY
jgi:LETM1 and EF-hand domain-containing protein 1, mitochondrial